MENTLFIPTNLLNLARAKGLRIELINSVGYMAYNITKQGKCLISGQGSFTQETLIKTAIKAINSL